MSGSGSRRWLLTVAGDVELAALARELGDLDVDLDADVVPLEPDEVVVACSGPSDLPERLRARPHPAILGVYPDSPQRLY